MKFIFRNKYIFKLLVILTLFYKNIFFYNSLCCNCCKENILDEKKNSKKIKTEIKKTKVEEIKPEIKKSKEKIIKTEKGKIKGAKIKPKVKKEELKEVDVFITDVREGKKYMRQFPSNIKGSDLKKKVAEIFKAKNIEIRYNSILCEGDTIYTLDQGGTLYVYKKNEKK